MLSLILTVVSLLFAPPRQHIVVAGTVGAAPAKPGATISLFVDVLPDAGIHVYAPGATDYEPINLKIAPNGEVAAGTLSYPKSETLVVPETGEKIPVYTKAFRLTQPITIAKTAKRGTTIVVSGRVLYQACDDRVCFVPAELPVSWTLDVK